MTTRLNLSSRPFRNRGLPWTVTAIVTLASIVALIFIARSTFQTNAQAQAAQNEVADLRMRTDALKHQAEAIKIASEVDRIYLDTTGVVEILDSKLRRRIRIEKSGSASTVVWNPWTAKAQQMPDFGNEEYRQMVCVESGNVAGNKIILPPSQSSVLKVTISSAPL